MDDAIEPQAEDIMKQTLLIYLFLLFIGVVAMFSVGGAS